MSERAKIQERLRRKELEIQGLEDKLRAARVYVQALQDILKLFDDEPASDGVVDNALKPGSAVAQARAVILERGEPVYIDDILAALGREATRETRASLVSSLAAYVRRAEIFTRPAPNTFGLIEMPSSRPPMPDPPAEFGRVEDTPPATPPWRRVNIIPAPKDDDTPF